MNAKSVFYTLMFLFCPVIGAEDAAIKSAIQRSDLEELHRIFVPGTSITSSDKKSYRVLAQAETKKAFRQLYSFSFSDIKHSGAALFKLAAAGFCAKEFWTLISTDTIETPETNQTDCKSCFYKLALSRLLPVIWYEFKPDEIVEKIKSIPVPSQAMVFTGLMAAYFGFKSVGDFLAIVKKSDRYNYYVRALAVEALVNRVHVEDAK